MSQLSKMVCQCTLNAIGYAGLTWAAYKVLTALYNILFPYFLTSPIDLKKKAGAEWAVVTGSTDGIGKAYAFDLARRGFKLLLVSRSQNKLEDTKKEINEKYQVEIKTFTFDFSAGNFADYAPLLAELKKYEIGVLVNNVGLSYEYPEQLHNVEGGLERVSSITTINTLPPTLLSAAVLSQMVPRKTGVIINLASAAAYNKMSYWAVYSATKKYVQWLSAILRQEYASQGIIIQTICPMLVATKMSKVKKTSLFSPNADKFAKSALNTVGHADETTGYFAHQLQTELFFSLPEFVLKRVLDHVSISTRKAALRKKERDAKKE